MSKLSVVISTYNEESVLPLFYDAFKEAASSLPWEWELIFVDDGSTDATSSLLATFAKEDGRIKVIEFSRNFGHEAAMIAGIDYATGDGIVCMDVDLQHPLSCLAPIIDCFEEGYEVVTMVRVQNRSAGFAKRITSKVYYRVMNHMSDQVTLEENASDFFAISARVADILRSNYREKRRFLRGYVQSVGFKHTSLEYVAPERAAGTSHYSLSKLFHFSIATLVSFSDMPLKLGIYAGLLSALAGVIVLVYTLFTYRTAPSGYATIVILICFMFAMLFILVGIIGEYLATLFSELKDRPIYLIEKKVNLD